MKALILAAGRGRRLWPFTVDKPKCLLDLEGISILQHQLRELERVGVRQAVVVCGFGVDKIRSALEACQLHLPVKMLYNPFYAIADNLISLWAARAEMDDAFLLLNGDGVFHPTIFRRLAEVEEDCCLMVARRATYDDDHMKVQIRHKRIVGIGKHLDPTEADAAATGVMRFSKNGSEHLKQVLEEVVLEPQALKSYFPNAVQHLIDIGYPITFREATDLPWADVDTPADLRFVRQHFHLFQDVPRIYGEVKGSV